MKTIIVKGLKVVAKGYLSWIFLFFIDDLYCCVEYSNVKYQAEIFNSKHQKQMIEYGFGHRFHDLNYIEVEIFVYSLNSLSPRGHHHKTL